MTPTTTEVPRYASQSFLEGWRAKRQLRRCSSVGQNVTVFGTVVIIGKGEIHIGNNVVIDGRLAPVELHAGANGSITLGDSVRLSGGTSIEAMVRVVVGPRTVLGGFSKVLDSNFHPVSGNRHTEAPTPPTPIFIGADCELGFRSIVLPGGQMGDRVTVLGNCVVSRKIPAGNVVGGMPLKRLSATPLKSP